MESRTTPRYRDQYRKAFAQLTTQALSELASHRSPQLFHNLSRRFARRLLLGHIERNGPHTRMATSSVAFTDLREIHHRLRRRPRIRSHGNLHPETTLAQAHAVNRFRMQIIRNELVVALKFVVSDIEENRAIFRFNALAQNPHRA